jgi:hypothetical protein
MPKASPASGAEPRPRYPKLPWLGAAAAAVGLLLQLAPQHRVASTGFFLCLAPDCKSSAFTTTETCGGLDYLAEAPFVAVTLVVTLVAQLLLATRAPRAGSGERTGTVVATLLGAIATGMGVLFHHVFQHLFDRLALGIGEIGVGLVLVSLLIIAPLELVTQKSAAAT